MSYPRFLAPEWVTPNVQELKALGVKIAFTARDGDLRMFFPITRFPTLTGTRTIAPARRGGLAVYHDTTSYSTIYGLEDVMSFADADVPITIIARYEFMGAYTTFDVWGGLFGIVSGTNSVCAAQMESSTSAIRVQATNLNYVGVASVLAAEKNDAILAMSSSGSGGRDMKWSENGVLIGSGTVAGNRTTSSSDVRFLINVARDQTTTTAGNSTFIDAFVFDRLVGDVEMREICTPGYLDRMYDNFYTPYKKPVSAGSSLVGDGLTRSAVLNRRRLAA